MEIGINAKLFKWDIKSGLDFNEYLFDRKDIRSVYDIVKPNEKTINKDNSRLSFEDNIEFIIESLEKNPDIKGIPIKAIEEILKIEGVKGENFIFKPIIRIS